MARSWLQRMLAPLLAATLALGMSVSVVQAAGLTVNMATGAAVGMVQHNKCPGCDHNSGSMKAVNCGPVLCAAQGIASLPQTFAIPVSVDGVDAPSPFQPVLVGWAHAPDPYPPRRNSLA